MAGLDEQLSALEAVVLDPTGDLETLASRLHERQELLDGVQAADVQGLPEPQRSQVRARLRGIYEGIESAMNALRTRRDQLVGQQDNVVQARQAARGYKPEMPGQKRSLTRNA